MVDIGAWTEDKFGTRQADKYLERMIADCHAIGMDNANLQSCRSAFGDDVPDDLHFSRSGRHFIIFVETAAGMVIVDFLHQSSDIGGKLGNLKT